MKVFFDAGLRVTVQLGMGIREDQTERRAGRVTLFHPIRERAQEIQALHVRIRQAASRALAPIKRERQRFRASDGVRNHVEHQTDVRRLLALERPCVERPQYLLGQNLVIDSGRFFSLLRPQSDAQIYDFAPSFGGAVPAGGRRVAQRAFARTLKARWMSSEQQILLLHSGPRPRQIYGLLVLPAGGRGQL